MSADSAIPGQMRAFVLKGHGDLDQLEFHENWPVPEPNRNEVLIKVHACGLNNTDVNTRTAWYSKAISDRTTGAALDAAEDDDASWGGASLTFPRIQGADVCGSVVKVGAAVDDSLLGRRVLVDTWLRDWDEPLNMDKCGYFGSECDGGFAEYTKVDYRNVHPVESELADTELATFATSSVTAENMLNRAGVASGDTVLIPGASGGVGSALIQLVNRRGATSIALCGDAKADKVRDIGPQAVLPRSPENLKDALRQATGSPSVTVVADVVGGADWASFIDVLERGGRYTCSGAIAGPMVDLDLRTFYLRDLTFTGATIVPPGTFADLVRYIERSEIRPLLQIVYPLERLHDAQQEFIKKRHVGNIVVQITE